MAKTNSNAHLTLDERIIIQKGIVNGSDKKSIANTIGKDNSTVAKEIKNHRYVSYTCAMPLECSNYRKCTFDRKCTSSCPNYSAFKCARRDRSPGACNGCLNAKSCRFTKLKYDAAIADSEYRKTLVSSRQGFNITPEEVKRLGSILTPLIKSGQSVEQILSSHPEITVTSRTIYTYIEQGLFKANGVDLTAMDLRRQVSRKLPKHRSNLYKNREDRSFLVGRKYSDYEEFMSLNPYSNVVQMDTVFNDITNGPYLQTFKFMKYGFIFSIFHKEKTMESMNNGVLLLEKILGPDLFSQEVEVLLTDRGSEFYGLKNLEVRDDGVIRTRVFYCDPMASCQKGSLENKHEELRYICPKHVDLYRIGLTDQVQTNLVLSHVNSSPRKKLDWKSPIEFMKFLNPSLFQKFSLFGITEIDRDSVVLKPYLLKK